MKKRISNHLFFILSVCILLLSSCEKDPFLEASITIPENNDVTELESHSYSIPINIESNMSWEASIEGDLAYVFPEKGSGNATINLCILDNDTDEEQFGKLIIRFPENESENCTYNLNQLSGSYSDENSVTTTGNKARAVGYGYNTKDGKFAAIESVKGPILAVEKMLQEGGIENIGVQASLTSSMYSGSNMKALSKKLSTKANLKASYMGFSGEIGASFDISQSESNSYEYCIAYIENAITTLEVQLDPPSLQDLIINSAYTAINGVSRDGVESSYYPTGDEGFANLINYYGTHLVYNAQLGGKLKYTTQVNVSEVQGAYNINTYAKAGYKNVFVSASAEVSAEMNDAYKKNSSHIKTNLIVSGGGRQEAIALSKISNATNENAKIALDNWSTSLIDDTNLTLINFDNNSLVPLYDLVDPKYKARKEALKKYMEDGSFWPADEYKIGDVHLLNIPDKAIGAVPTNKSLVSAVYDKTGSHQVAVICDEYIPILNVKERVTVIYPIINNKTKWNIGYFVGDEANNPAFVCWTGTKVSINKSELEGDNVTGRKKKVYLQGAVFNSIADVGTNIKVTPTINKELKTPRGYSIVKVLNNYWTRTDLRETAAALDLNTFPQKVFINEGDDLTKLETGNYLLIVWSHVYEVAGWKVANANDWIDIRSWILSNELTGDFSNTYQRKGRIGLDVIPTKYQFIDSKNLYGDFKYNTYIVTSAMGHNGVLPVWQIYKVGEHDGMDAVQVNADQRATRGNIRLVQKLWDVR